MSEGTGQSRGEQLHAEKVARDAASPYLADDIYQARPIREGRVSEDGARWIGLCAYRLHPAEPCGAATRPGGFYESTDLITVVDALAGHRAYMHPTMPQRPDWYTQDREYRGVRAPADPDA